MSGFFVYEYVHQEGRKAEVRTVLHLGDCRWCQNGKGRDQNAGLKRGLGRWHGLVVADASTPPPSSTLAPANAAI
jgi:hypothetical protein